MKRFNKFLSAVLVGTMAISLVACGNKPTKAPVSESTVTSETTAVTPTETAPAEPETYEVNYPVDTDVKLSIFSMQPSVHANYASWEESPYHTMLQANTGIYVDYKLVSSSERLTKYNLLWTSSMNEIPKMVVNTYGAGELDTLVDEGMLWDLTDYVEQYAPDYWAFLNEEGNEILLKSAYTEKGRIVSVGGYLENDFNATFTGPVIRQDWLDECGLKAPVTLEDWENVLEVFKEKYGATLGFAMGRFAQGIASGVGAYTSLKADTLYIDDNGKIQYGAVQPEYKEMLTVLNRWYQKGLIDMDSFTMNNNGVREKAAANKIGISFLSMADLTKIVNDAKAEGGTGANWVGIEYPRTEPGAPTNWIQTQNRAISNSTAITKGASEEEMIACLQWLNYGFTEEGFMYQNFGTEGVSYTVDANGNIAWTDLLNDENGNFASGKLTMYTGTGSTAVGGIQAADHVKLKNSQEAVDAVAKWVENTEVSKHFLPGFKISADDSTEYTDKMTLINTRSAEMAMKFVVGEESLDKFDDYVKELEGYGLADCLAIQQKAYDAFLAK